MSGGDPRVQNLAKILVGYSTEVKEDDVVAIDGESAAAPLLLVLALLFLSERLEKKWSFR